MTTQQLTYVVTQTRVQELRRRAARPGIRREFPVGSPPRRLARVLRVRIRPVRGTAKASSARRADGACEPASVS